MASPPSHAAPIATHERELPSDVAQPAETLPGEEEDALEADTALETDSAYGESVESETTSVASHYKGYFENGRRYQSVRDEEYYQPADEAQWEAMDKGHLLFLILDSERSNALFRSPISAKAQNILDLGTGSGAWALDVADHFPNITVRGVDLFPPPQPYTAPNCIFEVDDITQNWTWNNKFDLVHMRNMLGALNALDWNRVYRHTYDNLAPGGWIEHVEQDVGIYCDDDTLPKDSILREWKKTFIGCAERADRPLDTYDHMKDRIEAVGFTNVHYQDYKLPVGTWPKLGVYKDAGRVCRSQFMLGMEGWGMFLLTKFGAPHPWSRDEFLLWCARVRNDLDAGYHVYNKARRVWAQKPYDREPEAKQ